MKMSSLLAAASALSLVAVAVPASAKIIPVTYSGTVSNGYDQTGLFGVAGASLSGANFVATYLINTALGTTSTYNYSYDYYYSYSYAINQAYGGSAYGTASPVVSSSVTINGKTVNVDPSYYGSLSAYNQTYNGSKYSSQSVTAQNYSYNGSAYKSIYLSNNVYTSGGTLLSMNLDDLFSGSVSDLNANGSFGAYGYDYNNQSQSLYTYADFATKLVTVGAVPEPATWLMMILGFGVVGVALRRRQVAQAAIA